MEFYFEGGGKYITAAESYGENVQIRCDFDYTDCGERESLDHFVLRHGGSEETVKYLKGCYQSQNRD